MSNTLTTLAPTLFAAAQVVSAEPFAIVDSIMMDFDDKGVAVGDSVTVPYAPVAAVTDFTPAATSSAGTDKTAAGVSVSITFSKKTSWHLTGEQIRSLENGGTYQEWVRQLMEQGMRSLRNYAETQAYDAVRKGASRAYGTAGTTPFASDLSALTNARKILQDNGAPLADLQFVGDTACGLNLRNLGIIQQAYQAGSDAERRSGNLLRQFGFRIGESAGITAVTKGTGSGYLIDMAGNLAVGDTTVTVDTGSGTILAGDVITFAGTSHKYVVGTALSGTTLVLNRPGSRAVEANNDAITVGNDFTANLAFERSAVVGIMRPPLMPANATITQIPISDGKGMTYLLLDIQQYGMRTWELHLAGGFKAVQPEHIALVLG